MKIRFDQILTLLSLTLLSCSEHAQFDILILNGNVYDGTGSAPQKADIGIIRDKIVRIGDLSSEEARTKIDASGRVVSPGFIDLHAHLGSIEDYSYCENLVRQGVTTALGGPDGGGPWPFGEHLESLTNLGVGINVGFLVGHNVIRKNVLQLENRAPTTQELNQMKEQVSIAMKEGAFGISTGLKYLPGTFSEIDEVIELSRVASTSGGFYTSHLRDEGLKLLEAVKEAIIIGREAKIPVVLTHHKVVGKPMWGASTKSLVMVDSATGMGQDIMLDQYPYTASRTGIGILIPSWSREGGIEKFKKRLSDSVLRDSIKNQTWFNLINDRGGADLKRVLLSDVSWNPGLNGKTLHDWCLIENLDPTFSNGAELVIKAYINGDTRCIFHAMSEDDIKRILKHPKAAVASDGVLTRRGDGLCHPRSYGTFPRVLAKYVREEKIIALEEAIRKMTSLPASRMGLKNRGVLKEENIADIVIFDAAQIKDKSTFTDPHQYPVGINYVLVNGKLVVEDGEFKKIKSGKVLYGPAKN